MGQIRVPRQHLVQVVILLNRSDGSVAGAVHHGKAIVRKDLLYPLAGLAVSTLGAHLPHPWRRSPWIRRSLLSSIWSRCRDNEAIHLVAPLVAGHRIRSVGSSSLPGRLLCTALPLGSKGIIVNRPLRVQRVPFSSHAPLLTIEGRDPVLPPEWCAHLLKPRRERCTYARIPPHLLSIHYPPRGTAHFMSSRKAKRSGLVPHSALIHVAQ
jgi:hypothetical protein